MRGSRFGDVDPATHSWNPSDKAHTTIGRIVEVKQTVIITSSHSFGSPSKSDSPLGEPGDLRRCGSLALAVRLPPSVLVTLGRFQVVRLLACS